MFWKLFDYINFNLASVFYNPMFIGQVVRSPNNKQEVLKAFKKKKKAPKSALLAKHALYARNDSPLGPTVQPRIINKTTIMKRNCSN